MQVVGLLGGIASGKSLVAASLRRRGAVVLDGDQAGHEVLRLPAVIEAARQRWGARVLAEDGQLDRAAIASIVFGNDPQAAAELSFLEQLTHPRIGELLREQAAAAAQDGATLLVVDAPLMLKGGWDKICTQIWFVDAPREVRLSRALGRGWSEAEFAAREAAQESLAEKRSRATQLIDNGGTREETEHQIDQLWTRSVP